MPRHAYLNELSFENPSVVIDEGRVLFEQLFRLLREITRHSNGFTIIGHCRLTELSIGGCSVGAWLRDDRDRMRRLRALDDRAPFDTDVERMTDESGGALEYRYREQTASGLGLAAWHDELAVSIDRSPWQTESVELQCYTVLEKDDGSVVDETTIVAARHATNASSPTVPPRLVTAASQRLASDA